MNTHTHTHTHIYIYMCVCVCVCNLLSQEHELRMNGAGGLVVQVLPKHVRDLGLSPSWIQFFSVNHIGVKDIYIFIIITPERTIALQRVWSLTKYGPSC